MPATITVIGKDAAAVPPVDGTAYIQMINMPLTSLTKKIEAMALGIEVVGTMWGETDPLLFVTDEPFKGKRVVLDRDDLVVALTPPLVAGKPQVPSWLLAWTATADGPARASSLSVGALALYYGPPDFQTAHHFDTWLYPQRVNYIANPSFEALNNKYWASSGTFTRVYSDVDGFAGQFVGENIVVEANSFPIDRLGDIWTIQMLIKGTGRVAVGLVYWTEEYDRTHVDWGDELWELSPNAYTHIRVLRNCSEAVEGMLRLQVEEGTGITIDKVLCEPGPLTDWQYFDGDEQYGAKDDFSWYGVRGESYSLWYNNKRSVLSRIFAPQSYTGSTFTEQDSHGLVYNWVPAGTVVNQHIDVLRPDDLKTPPAVKTGVMPDDVADPIFGVPGGTLNVLTTVGARVHTAAADEEVEIAKVSP